MFFSKTYLFAALLVASVSASAPASPLPDGCIVNGCACDGPVPGNYCGICEIIYTGWWAVPEFGTPPHADEPLDGNSWNFECLPDGGCCSYGTTKQCADFATGLVEDAWKGACTST